MSMYVRIKRKTQTFFLSCEPTESVKSVKEEVSRLVGIEPRDIKFVGPDKARELPDGASIADQGFQNDSVIYMVYREGGGDGWEDVDVDIVTGSGQLK